MVSRALKEYGIEARTTAKRSGLREYSLKKLECGVKRKGTRGVRQKARG